MYITYNTFRILDTNDVIDNDVIDMDRREHSESRILLVAINFGKRSSKEFGKGNWYSTAHICCTVLDWLIFMQIKIWQFLCILANSPS